MHPMTTRDLQFLNGSGSVVANIQAAQGSGALQFYVNTVEMIEIHSDTGGRLLGQWFIDSVLTNRQKIVCNGATGGGTIQCALATSVASANTLTLDARGNLQAITGTTTINGIVTAGWQAGTKLALKLVSGITVTHNSGTPGGGAVAILLRAAANLTTAAAYLLELWYDGTNWIQPG
jgi:hypothetical protein